MKYKITVKAQDQETGTWFEVKQYPAPAPMSEWDAIDQVIKAMRRYAELECNHEITITTTND